MTSNLTNSKRVLYMDDKLSFGKYAGKLLAEVWEEDQSYVNWLNKNVTNYRFEWNVNKSWRYILDETDVAPNDGLYVIAYRGDMHIEYEICKLNKGDRFWDKIHCWDVSMAYICFNEYSELSNEWKITTDNIESKPDRLVICAINDEVGDLQYIVAWDHPSYLEDLVIKGCQFMPRFTEEMHSFFWEKWYEKHPFQTNEIQEKNSQG